MPRISLSSGINRLVDISIALSSRLIQEMKPTWPSSIFIISDIWPRCQTRCRSKKRTSRNSGPRVEADGHQSLKLRILARLDRPRTSMLRPEVSTRSPTTLRWANCSRCTAVIPSITRSKRCIINGRLLRPLRTEDRYTFRTHQACNRRITGTNKRNGCSQLGTCISNQCREEVLPTMKGLRAATSSSTTCLMRRLMTTCWGCSARLGEF